MLLSQMHRTPVDRWEKIIIWIGKLTSPFFFASITQAKYNLIQKFVTVGRNDWKPTSQTVLEGNAAYISHFERSTRKYSEIKAVRPQVLLDCAVY